MGRINPHTGNRYVPGIPVFTVIEDIEHTGRCVMAIRERKKRAIPSAVRGHDGAWRGD